MLFDVKEQLLCPGGVAWPIMKPCRLLLELAERLRPGFKSIKLKVPARAFFKLGPVAQPGTTSGQLAHQTFNLAVAGSN